MLGCILHMFSLGLCKGKKTKEGKKEVGET